MRKPRKRKITKYITFEIFDDRESDCCPVLIEDNFQRDEGAQNWLTYKEAKNLQYVLNTGLDWLERQYAKPTRKNGPTTPNVSRQSGGINGGTEE